MQIGIVGVAGVLQVILGWGPEAPRAGGAGPTQAYLGYSRGERKYMYIQIYIYTYIQTNGSFETRRKYPL